MFRKGDIVGYKSEWETNQPVRTGIFVSYGHGNRMSDIDASVVWGFWNGSKSLTYVETRRVFLVKKKTKEKNLPSWW